MWRHLVVTGAPLLRGFRSCWLVCERVSHMSESNLLEEPLQFGDGGRLFGILTLPSMLIGKARELPVFVFLNAGMLHRVGPYRLHVRLARDLSRMGFSSIRVDLAD